MIKAAKEIWAGIPAYEVKPFPKSSDGWLAGFKERKKVQAHTRHGEAGSVDVATVAGDMDEVKKMTDQFALEDIWHFDESGLYWKMTPDRGLSHGQISGTKKVKARLTVALCCNASGTEKLPVLLIGTAARPLAFRAAGVNTSAMDFQWHHNGSAWMTGSIMEAWLRWFDQRMSGRRVLLLMDNFSAHHSALDAINAMGGLQNTVVHFLPENATSVHQPLDQGIIQSFKCHYRRQWLRYMLTEINAGQDPVNTVNVLKAARFCIEAWKYEVTPQTCANCFRKSGVLGPTFGPLPRPKDF